MTDTTQFERAGTVTLGGLVVALYVFFVVLVFAGFATYIYRTDWHAALTDRVVPDPNGGATITDLDNLIFVLKREKALEESLALLNAQRQVDEITLRRHDAVIEGLEGEFDVMGSEELGAAFFAIASFKSLRGHLLDKDQLLLDAILGGTETTVVSRAKEALAMLTRLDPGTLMDDMGRNKRKQMIESYQAQVDRFVARKKDIGLSLKSEHEARTKVYVQVLRSDEVIKTQSDQLRQFQEMEPLGSAERARFDALSTEVWPIGNSLQRLVSYPTIFLTLIVTIASGGLGTVVAFSRRYYGNGEQDINAARLLVNVGEGIAAAIAIFLCSGAGMLALTQGGGNTNDVELSPYMVAFIAFVSGFMAEDAFARIGVAGKKLFGTEEVGKT